MVLKNSSQLSTMEQYSDSEVDQDSELEISIDSSSEVNIKYPGSFKLYSLHIMTSKKASF